MIDFRREEDRLDREENQLEHPGVAFGESLPQWLVVALLILAGLVFSLTR